MVERLCMACRQDVATVVDATRLWRSSICGHSACTKCLTEVAGARVGTDPTLTFACPVCSEVQAAKAWEDTTNESALFEKEASVRTRVLSVLNADRPIFPNTPQYNQFLEEREQVVYDLLFSPDLSLIKKRTDFLRQYEIENQTAILEASERARKREDDRIRDAVSKEGLFYEVVKVSQFGPGLIPQKIVQSRLLHPLQREHPHLFHEAAGAAAEGRGVSGVGAAPVGAVGGGVVGSALTGRLFSNLPRTLIPNIVYDQIVPQRSTDRKSEWEAGGHTREPIASRTTGECLAGFHWLT